MDALFGFSAFQTELFGKDYKCQHALRCFQTACWKAGGLTLGTMDIADRKAEIAVKLQRMSSQ
jgi:hypothetical protein